MSNPIPIVIVLVALALLVAGSSDDGTFLVSHHPVTHNYCVSVPREYHQRNYGSSCCWSTTIMALRALDNPKSYRAADWIRRNRIGGAGPRSVNAALRECGVRYAYTTDGDTRLIDWALKHNRAVCLGFPAYHSTLLTGRKNGRAIILDNYGNGNGYYTVPYPEFIWRWRNNAPDGGWAWVVLPDGVTPPPEIPFVQGSSI